MKRLTTVAALLLGTTSSFVGAQTATAGHYASLDAGAPMKRIETCCGP